MNENGFKTVNDNKDTWHPPTIFLGDYIQLELQKMHHSRKDLRTIDSTNPPAKLHLYFEGKLEVTLNKKPKFSTLKKRNPKNLL